MKRALLRLTLFVILGAMLLSLCSSCALNDTTRLEIVRGAQEQLREEPGEVVVPVVQPSFVGRGSGFEPKEFVFSGRIFLMGDSTMCSSYSENRVSKIDIMGWGGPLSDYFVKTSGETRGVKIYNYASSGASSRSFQSVTTTTGEGKRLKIYDYVFEHLTAGDYLFIQFGHNDGDSTSSEDYTSAVLSMEDVGEDGRDANGVYSFEWVLYNAYIKPCLEIGAVPVLVTPIAIRDGSTGLGEINPHLPYRAVMQRLAETFHIPLIDLSLETKTYYADLVSESGALATTKLHAFSDDNRTQIDNTHLSRYGAFVVAGLAAKELAGTDLTLCNFLLSEPSEIQHPREN